MLAIVCAKTTEPHLNTQTPLLLHTGRLLSTTSGVHEGDTSVESRDGHEHSIPHIKCHGESNVLLRESVHGESETPTGYVYHQHYNHLQQHSSVWHSSPTQLPSPTPAWPLQSSTESCYPPIQPSLPPTLGHADNPLGKYALFLRGYYTQHYSPCTKWPQLHARKYINLAVINNVCFNREDLVQFREQTIHGCIDDILELKAPIEMQDILKPNHVYDRVKDEQIKWPVTQLLIEGAPGIGKSTFAWGVCQKWGLQQLFNEFSLVVLLKFRDKRIQEANSIFELFYHPNPKLQSDILDVITATGGQGLLLILEGFDEAPASNRKMDSIFVRLFTGQELPRATVILTTRPSASTELRQFCNNVNSRRIEIVGFGKKQIDEYIECVFSDEHSHSDFKKYLSLYPHIHSMMYVPLNSAIVAHVYDSCKSSGVVPKTMTQLYSSLIRTLLLRYLKDKEIYKDTRTNIHSFKDLPSPLLNQFLEICKIAYTGIMSTETELIFQDLPSDFDPLGLMQTCPELYVDRGASFSYNFLHLTLQEYLAACYISWQSMDEQVAFMRENFESKKLEVVMRFLAGLSDLGGDLWDVVRGFSSKDKPNDVMSWLWQETNFIKLKVLHWLFESQDPFAITSVLGSDYVCFSQACHNTRPFDWYVLGYCITHSSCDWKLELVGFKLESVEVFLKELNHQQDQCPSPKGQIKQMLLLYSKQPPVHLLVANIPKLSVFRNLTHLDLMNCDLTLETCNHLAKHSDLLQKLECLYLTGNDDHKPTIGRGGAVNLITSLTKFSTIRNLKLRKTDIGLEDCKALRELLATSKYIEMLDIMDNHLSSDSTQQVVDGLFHNTSLEKLNMTSSNFSSDNVLSLALVLRMNTRLKELVIERCNIQSSDSVCLAKAIEENTNTHLQTLRMYGDALGSEGASAFACMLSTNKSLIKFSMSNCSIEEVGAVCLAKALGENSTVTEFDISFNQVGSEGAAAFAGMLAKNKTLSKLNMTASSVQGVGAFCMAKALEKNSTVSELNVSSNKLGSKEAVGFANMLATNRNLAKLDMSHCSIQGECAVCLAKAMEKNSTVSDLDLSGNPVELKGTIAIARMLKRNQCLRTLKLIDIDDSVGVEGALEVIKSMEYNTTLEKLVLSKKCKPFSFSTQYETLQNRVEFCEYRVYI